MRRTGIVVLLAFVLGACQSDLRPPIGVATQTPPARTEVPGNQPPRPLPEPTMTFGEAVIRSGDRGALVEAQSSPVEMGVTYLFEVGHCGLTWYTDFDGSYWRVVDKHPLGRDPVALINGDRGEMTLVSEDRARYEGSDGKVVHLQRAGRTWHVFYCA